MPVDGRERMPAAPPDLDDVANAVVRATARYSPSSVRAPSSANVVPPAIPWSPAPAEPHDRRSRPTSTDPISPLGPLHQLLEGTVIDTVLTNRLDGATASPVNCLVTNPTYSHGGQQILIPAGSRVLGETKAVQSVGESRLAVAFHRLILPDGRTVGLDQFTGVNQTGDAALRDQVNHHYLSTFGAASAVGILGGLGQALGTVGFGQGSNDRPIVIAGGFGNATSEAVAQVMNRFLNRLPTITIREGHRVKVYLTSDLELPAYEERTLVAPSTARVPQ
jgi:type IV secretory pathway VirB10-like protein